MRHLFLTITLASSPLVLAQEVKPTPTEELRTTVREWVETMRKIQQEENDWARDQEVLANYKEGLEKEIAGLKEQIAEAKTRKEGIDKESADKLAERDRYVSAKVRFTELVRQIEDSAAEITPLVPESLLSDPKVAQAIEDMKRDLALPVEKRGEGLSKRLLNVINLVSESEKFQQSVHLRSELHKDSNGKEFNMQVIYFGLAIAYAVNDEGTFALVGQPGPEGWKFEEKSELAADILNMVITTRGDKDAAFIPLPFSKP
jgi:hypothetical protein